MSSYFGTTCELCICGSVKRIIVENFVVLSVIHEEEKMAIIGQNSAFLAILLSSCDLEGRMIF